MLTATQPSGDSQLAAPSYQGAAAQQPWRRWWPSWTRGAATVTTSRRRCCRKPRQLHRRKRELPSSRLSGPSSNQRRRGIRSCRLLPRRHATHSDAVPMHRTVLPRGIASFRSVEHHHSALRWNPLHNYCLLINCLRARRQRWSCCFLRPSAMRHGARPSASCGTSTSATGAAATTTSAPHCERRCQIIPLDDQCAAAVCHHRTRSRWLDIFRM